MLWLVALILWILLMLLWLLGGSYTIYSGPAPSHVVWVTGSLIPWACVFILGLFFFGAFGPPMTMTQH